MLYFAAALKISKEASSPVDNALPKFERPEHSEILPRRKRQRRNHVAGHVPGHSLETGDGLTGADALRGHEDQNALRVGDRQITAYHEIIKVSAEGYEAVEPPAH